MSLSDSVRERIEQLVDSNRVVLFMKGTPQQPMCGFSARTVAALDSLISDWSSVNVLDDEEIREGIKIYGEWPTIPQLYVDGELIGGCDIVQNMLNAGELHALLGLEAPDRTPPDITITPLAAEKISEAMTGHAGVGLHFAVDANWGAQFNLAPEGGHEIASESQGIRVLMDLATAQRARGATIDWVSNLHGEGLAIDLPLAPPPVQALSVSDLKSRLDSGDITLIDVRSEDERGMASIEQAIALDVDQVEAMPRDSELAFLCHHGNSSMGAAEYFRKKGFTRVYNVTGGINAWALEVDSSVPTY